MDDRQPAPQRKIEVPSWQEDPPLISRVRNQVDRVGNRTSRSGTVGPEKAPRYADVGHETMTPELIMLYRGRIASGVYDAPATIFALAEALLASFDL